MTKDVPYSRNKVPPDKPISIKNKNEQGRSTRSMISKFEGSDTSRKNEGLAGYVDPINARSRNNIDLSNNHLEDIKATLKDSATQLNKRMLNQKKPPTQNNEEVTAVPKEIEAPAADQKSVNNKHCKSADPSVGKSNNNDYITKNHDDQPKNVVQDQSSNNNIQENNNVTQIKPNELIQNTNETADNESISMDVDEQNPAQDSANLAEKNGTIPKDVENIITSKLAKEMQKRLDEEKDILKNQEQNKNQSTTSEQIIVESDQTNHQVGFDSLAENEENILMIVNPLQYVKNLLGKVIDEEKDTEAILWKKIADIKQIRDNNKKALQIQNKNNREPENIVENAKRARSPQQEPNSKIQKKDMHMNENPQLEPEPEAMELGHGNTPLEALNEKEKPQAADLGQSSDHSSDQPTNHQAGFDSLGNQNATPSSVQTGNINDQTTNNQRKNRTNNNSTPTQRNVEQSFIIVMEFEEQDKNFLKCPVEIQEAINRSQINRQHITNLRQNHMRGMLIFFINNENEAAKLIPLQEFGGKMITCRWSKDTDIQQGVIGPIQCPTEREAANNKIRQYMKLMEEAGNPVKSMEWIIKTETDGTRRITNSVLLEFEDNEVAPEIVKIGNVPYTVRPYIRQPTQCFNCQCYGHVAKYCKAGPPRCVFCGEKGHAKRENKCSRRYPRCCLCRGNHQAYSKRCPIYQKERVAQIIKAKSKTSIHTARELADKKQYPSLPEQHRTRQPPTQAGPRQPHGSYAGALANRRTENTIRPPSSVPDSNPLESRTQPNINPNENFALPPPLRDDRPQPPNQQNTRNAQQSQEEQIDQLIYNGRQEATQESMPSNMPQSSSETTIGNNHKTQDAPNISKEQFLDEYMPTIIEAVNNQISQQTINTTIVTIMKEVMPHMMKALLTTVYLNMPNERKEDIMTTRVEEILEAQANKTEIPNTRGNKEQNKNKTEATNVKKPVKDKTKSQNKNQPSQTPRKQGHENQPKEKPQSTRQH